jgi:hypothetical protein
MVVTRFYVIHLACSFSTHIAFEVVTPQDVCTTLRPVFRQSFAAMVIVEGGTLMFCAPTFLYCKVWAWMHDAGF